MYSFDSLTLKYFYIENLDFIQNAIVQKIQLPSRCEFIFTLRNLESSKNKKLYININPKYPHICFVNEQTLKKRNIEIPTVPPMFCMQLRKYLNGSKIKDFKYIEYDRILEFYFDYFNEIGSLTKLCLSVEFMGKYSNIILYEVKSKTIIGVAHNVSNDKSSIRELYGGVKYIYPPLKQKLDILNISYATFYEIAKNKDIKAISDNFYYFNQTLTEKILNDFNNTEDLYNFSQKLMSMNDKKYMCNFWGGDSINNAIDSYFSEIIFIELIKSKKIKLNKIVAQQTKKLQKIIEDAPIFDKVNLYKEKADFIMANLYSPENINFELDKTMSLSENAQKYYKLYKKALKSYEYSKNKIDESKEKLNYLETILFSIDTSNEFSELSEIETELGISDKKNKELPIIKKIEYKGYDIYLGKNNKQNDYLISKIANSEDIWFHGLNYPSAHVILKAPKNKKEPDKDIIEFCAKLTKENSKARNGGKASVIMTRRKNLKKPPNTYPGYVTYKNETEIVI